MTPAIRRAALDDVSAIRALERQAPSAAHWSAGEYERRIDSGLVLVAEQKGQLCGFVCAAAAAGEWELENIVVATYLLRLGVADGLMHALIDEAGYSQASKIVLEVRASNLPARRLYEKHGFREVGLRRSYYRDPQEDAVLYTRPI